MKKAILVVVLVAALPLLVAATCKVKGDTVSPTPTQSHCLKTKDGCISPPATRP